MIFNEEVKKLRGTKLNTIPMIQEPFEEMIKELDRGALTRSSWSVVHFHELLLKFSLLTNLSIHVGEDLKGKDLFKIYASVLDTKANSFGSLLQISRDLSKILQKMVEDNHLAGQHAQNLHVLVEYFDHSRVGGKDIVQWRNTQLAHATALSSEDDQNKQKDLKSLVTGLADFLHKNTEYFNKTLFEEVKLAPFISQREHIAYLYDQLKSKTYYPLFVSYNSNADQLVDKNDKEIKAIYEQVKHSLILDRTDISAEGNTYTKEEKETIEQISKDNRHEKFTFINELLNEAIQENPTGARFLIRMESGMGKSTFVRQMLGGLDKDNKEIIYKAFFCNNIFAFSHETFTNTCLETLKQFEGSTLDGLTLSGRQGFADSMTNLFNDALNIYKERSQDNTKIVFFIDGIDELTLKNENFLSDFLAIDLNDFDENIYFVFTCRSKSDTSDYINQIIDKSNFSKILEIGKKDDGYQQMLENFVKKYRPKITNEALKGLFTYIDNKFLAMELYIKILDESPSELHHVQSNDTKRYLSSLKSLYGSINYREIEKLIAYFCLIPLPITLDLLKGFVGAQNITFQLLCYLKIISPLIDTRRGEYETYFSITRPEFIGYGFESTQDILEDMKAEIVEYYDESLKEEKIKDCDFLKHFNAIISLKYNKRNLSSTIDEITSVVRAVIDGQEDFDEPVLKDFARDFNLAMTLVGKTFLIRKMELLLSCTRSYLKKKDDGDSLNYIYDKNKNQKVLVQSLFFVSYYNVNKESPDELLMYANNLLGKLEYIESPEKIKIIEKIFEIVAQSLPEDQALLWAQTLNRMADILTQASRAAVVIEQMENLIHTLEVPEKELLKQSLALAYLDVQEFEFAKQSIIDARNYINNTRKPKILAIQNATYRAYIENISKNYDISVNILKPYRSFVDDIRLREQSLNDLFIIVKYFESYADATIKDDLTFAQQYLNRALEIYSLIEHKYKISVLLYQVDNYITRSRLHKEAQESYIILQKGVSLVEQNKHGETGKLLIKLYEAIIELFRIDTNINNNISRESRRKLILEYSFKIIDICDSLEKNNLVFDKDKKLHMVARISELSKDFEHPECIKSFDNLDEDNSHIHILDTQHEFERAVLENNIKAMETLTKDNNIDLDYLYDFDKTALVLAVEYGSLDAAEWLIDHKADINVLDINGRSALSIACGRGYITIVEKILSTNKLDKYYPCIETHYIQGYTPMEIRERKDILANPYPLIEATKNGYLDIVKLLLDYGLAIDTGAGRGENALISSLKNGYTDIAKYLIEQGADINYKGKCKTIFYGEERDKTEIQHSLSPVDITVKEGYIEIIQLLITKGANEFLMSLTVAVEKEDAASLRSLLNQHQKFNELEDRLKIRDIFKNAAINGKTEVLKIMVDAGVDICQQVEKYSDLVYLRDVIKNGHSDTFLYLLSQILKHNSGYHTKQYFSRFLWEALVDVSKEGNIKILKEMVQTIPFDPRYFTQKIILTDNSSGENHFISPLRMAVKNGQLEVVEFLLNNVVNPLLVLRSAKFYLELACNSGNSDMLALLFRNGIKPKSDCSAEYLTELLGIAQKLGHKQIIYTIEKEMVDDLDACLILSVMKCNLNIMNELLEAGADIKITDYKGQTLLHHAVAGSLEMVRELLTRGVSINAVDNLGRTPLYCAKVLGNSGMIKELINQGADVNLYYIMPLVNAVHDGNVEVVRELLDHGADINSLDRRSGNFPLYAAVCDGNLEMVKELLKQGADPNDPRRGVLLIIALEDGRWEIAHELINRGARANFERFPGRSALHIAMRDGCTEIVREMLKQGVDVNKGNRPQRTPIYLAIINEHLEVLKLVLEGDTQTYFREWWIKIAIEDGHFKVVKLFLDKVVTLDETESSIKYLELAYEKGHLDITFLILDYIAKHIEKTSSEYPPKLLQIAEKIGYTDIPSL